MDVCGDDTIILITREIAGVDRYGNDVFVDTETTVPGCAVQPMWGSEDMNASDQAIDRFRVWFPGLAYTDLGVDPSMFDAVRHAGIVYEINGWGQPWRIAGIIDHVVLYLRRATG